MKRTLLLSPDTETQQDAGGTLPAPAPPPAAKAVVESDAKEGDAAALVEAKRALDEERRLRKERETRCAELEDENHRLKSVPAPTPAPAPRAKRAPNTFFDEESD